MNAYNHNMWCFKYDLIKCLPINTISNWINWEKQDKKSMLVLSLTLLFTTILFIHRKREREKKHEQSLMTTYIYMYIHRLLCYFTSCWWVGHESRLLFKYDVVCVFSLSIITTCVLTICSNIYLIVTIHVFETYILPINYWKLSFNWFIHDVFIQAITK
jgi:hypothetical protein